MHGIQSKFLLGAGILVALACVTSGARADDDAPLPADAGPNLALRKTYVSSDPNPFKWGEGGLTDGSWVGDSKHTFATGIKNEFPKTVTVDLQKAVKASLIRIGVPPFGSTKTVAVAVSADNQAFSDVGTYVFSQKKAEKHFFTFAPVSTRFVRLTYTDYYEGKVNFDPMFAFTTEVEVYAPTDTEAQKAEAAPTDVSAPADAGPNLALRKTYEVSDPNPSKWGEGGLTDGSWVGDSKHTFATGQKAAFPKTATIDLGQAANLQYVLLGVPAFGSTKTITVSISADGQTFTEVGAYVFSQLKEEKHLYKFAPVSARYVRLTYPDSYNKTVGYLPTYVFTTEAEVYGKAQ